MLLSFNHRDAPFALVEGLTPRSWAPRAVLSRPDLGKKVLIVYAHQEPRSFNGSLKDVAVAELSRQGCRVTVSDLYAMGFEPSATRKDVTGALCVVFLSFVLFRWGRSLRKSLLTSRVRRQTWVFGCTRNMTPGPVSMCARYGFVLS